MQPRHMFLDLPKHAVRYVSRFVCTHSHSGILPLAQKRLDIVTSADVLLRKMRCILLLTV